MTVPANTAVVTQLGSEIWINPLPPVYIYTGALGVAATGAKPTLTINAFFQDGRGNIAAQGNSVIAALGLSFVPPTNAVKATGKVGFAGVGISFVTTQRDRVKVTGMAGARVHTALPLPSCPTLPVYAQADFAAAQCDLLPQGRAWPKFETSNLVHTVEALVGSYARDVVSPVGDTSSAYGSTARSMQLLQDTMPWWAHFGAAAVTELLPEWNETLGLPDPCLPGDASLDQQIKTAVARFTGTGGQSIPYIIDFCAALGYNVEVTEYAPFMADVSAADSALADEQSWFFWSITTPNSGSWEFEASLNVADDPLGGFGNEQLACELKRIAPGHTSYSVMYI